MHNCLTLRNQIQQRLRLWGANDTRGRQIVRPIDARKGHSRRATNHRRTRAFVRRTETEHNVISQEQDHRDDLATDALAQRVMEPEHKQTCAKRQGDRDGSTGHFMRPLARG